jgi:hypothetical protein
VDDILCWEATMQELMTKLDTILLRCKAIGNTLSIKQFKISTEVAFAGYVVKQGAISPSPERAIAIKEFPRPQNIHELRSFLGLAQQLAGFIPDLAHASELLRHLLKKEKKWIWSFDLQDILGHTKRKAKSYAKKRLLARPSEQRSRQAFKMIQDPGNKQKLRRPHVLTPVPMGLPLTSGDWNEEDSDNWCRKHVPNWQSDRRIIDVVSDDNRMESYYHEGKKLYKVQQRRLKRTDATYDREDLDLAASLRRNAAAAAAACTPDDAWE